MSGTQSQGDAFRRRLMNSLRVAAVVFLLAQSAGATEQPPNIVFLLGDDQAWFDFGFMGSHEVATPNIDRLAGESAVFPRGYVPTSLCTPSLGTVITGRFPHEHHSGIGLHGLRAAPDIVREQYERCPPLPVRLASADYLSLQTGKWWEQSYKIAGFTHGMTTGTPVIGSRLSSPPDATGPKQIANLEKGLLFLAGAEGLRIGREGLSPIKDFLQSRDGKPFFLWYAPMMPHTPHNPPKRLYDKYQRPDRTESQILYMAMCEWADESVGELLTLLESEDARENTLIVFVVDNGFIPHKDVPGLLDPRSKTSPYDAGVRTPMLLNWPGRIRPGVRNEVVHTIDLAPTVLAAAGLDADPKLPGVNLLDVCDGKPLQREAVFGANFRHKAEKPMSPSDTMDFRWCVAWPWKLILPRELEKPAELYNLDDDPRETKNVADSNADRVRELTSKIDTWWPEAAMSR
jgi:arylsulfatase A-like enzyme